MLWKFLTAVVFMTPNVFGAPTLSPRNGNEAVKKYQEAVQKVITTSGEHFCLANQAWDTIKVTSITHPVVEAAHNSQSHTKTALSLGQIKGAVISERPVKSLTRIGNKYNTGGAWKGNSDLAAFRVSLTDYSHADSIVKQIQAVASAAKGTVCIKPTFNPSKPDITQFIYVYLPASGFVTEIQISHEFATWTFARDTYEDRLRKDNPALPALYPKNAWSKAWGKKDTSFYEAMQKLILNPTNPEKFDPIEALKEVEESEMGGKNMAGTVGDEELRKIIGRVYKSPTGSSVEGKAAPKDGNVKGGSKKLHAR